MRSKLIDLDNRVVAEVETGSDDGLIIYDGRYFMPVQIMGVDGRPDWDLIGSKYKETVPFNMDQPAVFCSRGACKKPLRSNQIWRNFTMGLLEGVPYCRRCACMINAGLAEPIVLEPGKKPS